MYSRKKTSNLETWLEVAVSWISLSCYKVVNSGTPNPPNFFGLINELIAKAHFEPSQLSAMEIFCKNSLQLKAVNYLRKKARSLMFE